MAKAILVIDISDDINIEECLANYEIFHRLRDGRYAKSYKTIQYEELVNLKPMPQKMDGIALIQGDQKIETVKWLYEYLLIKKGRDEVIDEILGEQE